MVANDRIVEINNSVTVQFISLAARRLYQGGLDGVIYCSGNTVSYFTGSDTVYAHWAPFYRNDEVREKLSPFIDDLGTKWLRFGFGYQVNDLKRETSFFSSVNDALVFFEGSKGLKIR